MEPSEPSALLTVTSTALLVGLRDPANRTIWSQYVARYRPLIVRTAERSGLSGDDAEDVAQATLIAFSEAYAAGQYRRERGRLRDWLFGILRNRLRSRGRELGRDRARAADEDEAGAQEPSAPDELARIWEEEWRDTVLRQCTEIVRGEVQPQTFEAFQRYVIEGQSAEDVAHKLDLAPEAVYDAKRRILRRLRELRPVLEESW